MLLNLNPSVNNWCSERAKNRFSFRMSYWLHGFIDFCLLLIRIGSNVRVSTRTSARTLHPFHELWLFVVSFVYCPRCRLMKMSQRFAPTALRCAINFPRNAKLNYLFRCIKRTWNVGSPSDTLFRSFIFESFTRTRSRGSKKATLFNAISTVRKKKFTLVHSQPNEIIFFFLSGSLRC